MPLSDGLWHFPGVHQVAAAPTASHWGSLLLLTSFSPSHSNNMVGYTDLGAQQSHLCHPYMVGRDLFPGSTPPDGTVDSKFVVRVKPGDSGVVIGY